MRYRLQLLSIGCILILAAWLQACRNSNGAAGLPQMLGRTHKLPPEVAAVTDSFYMDARKTWDTLALRRTVDSLLAIYPAEKDSFAHAELQLSKGLIYVHNDVWDSVSLCIRDAAIFYDAHPEYPVQRILCYEKLGYAYYFQQDQAASVYMLNKAGVELGTVKADSIFNHMKLARLYHDIAGLNRISQLFEQAQRYIRYAVHYGLKVKDKNALPLLEAYQEAFIIYMSAHKLDSARYFLQEMNSLSAKFPGNISVQRIQLNHNASYYYEMKQWDSAYYYCLKTVQLDEADKDVDSASLANEYSNIGDILTWRRELPRAGAYLMKAKQIMDRDTAALLDDKLHQDENLLHYYIMTGNREKAEQQLVAFTKTTRSYYDKERTRIINELEAQYNVKEKEKHIHQLNAERKIVGDELRSKNLLLLISILVILLAGTFVVLLAVILRQRRITGAKEKVELEQRLLRSQMEPHFIFNTLSVLQHIIRSDQKEKAIKYLRNFAGLLRVSLENSRESLVPLADEVKALENYLSLQELRFEDKFSHRLEVYEGYEEDELLVPPMLLQPFVENAIEHGLRNVKAKGEIIVHINKLDGVLECTIEDNGSGLRNHRPGGHKRSLSTTITRERLEILGKKTGRPASVEVMDKTTGTGLAGETGTRVRLIIPFQ